jgi:hypothetical protein
VMAMHSFLVSWLILSPGAGGATAAVGSGILRAGAAMVTYNQ